MKSAVGSCLRCLLAAVALAVPPVATAALFKCVAKDGAVSYQADPCPIVADEKRLKEPAAGPVAVPGKSSPRSPWKEGWVEADITEMADGCVPGAIGPARRDFMARAAGNPNAQFPEAELMPPLKAMCLCFARRVGSTYARADYQRDRAAILQRMNNEAMNGGACKPEGLLGEVMGQGR